MTALPKVRAMAISFNMRILSFLGLWRWRNLAYPRCEAIIAAATRISRAPPAISATC